MMTQRKKLPPTFMMAASCWSVVTLIPQSRGPWS